MNEQRGLTLTSFVGRRGAARPWLVIGLTTLFFAVGAANGRPQPPQVVPGNLIQKIPAANGATAPKPSGATKFQPSSKRSAVDNFMSRLGGTPEQKKQLRANVEALFKTLEDEAERLKMNNDVAGAATLCIITLHGISTGNDEFSDAMERAVYRQMQGALDSDDMRKATDTQKQEQYDSLMGTAVFSLLRYGLAKETKDSTSIREAKEGASNSLRGLMGTNKIRITDSGIQADGVSTSEKPSGSSPRPSGASLPTVAPLQGWTREEGKTSGLNTYSIKTARGTLTVLLATGAIALTANREQDFVDFYNSSIKPLRDQNLLSTESMDLVGRRYISGCPAWFKATRAKLGDGADMDQIYIYLIETSPGVGYGFVALYRKVDTGGVDASIGTFATIERGGKDEAWSGVESFLGALRLTTPSTKPSLFSASELKGKWEKRVVASTASYVSPGGSYAGDASSGFSESLSLSGDGTFTQIIALVVSGKPGGSQSSGTWKIEGDNLILNTTKTTRSSGPSVEKRRIVSAGRSKDGQRQFILLSAEIPLSLYGVISTSPYRSVQ